jgi:hypothetical protein
LGNLYKIFRARLKLKEIDGGAPPGVNYEKPVAQTTIGSAPAEM